MTSSTVTAQVTLPRTEARGSLANGAERLLPAFAAFLGAALPIVILPNEEGTTFEPKFALVMVLAAVGLVHSIALARRSQYAAAARVGLGFVAACVLSAAISSSPLVGFFGLFMWGEGAIFFLALVGAWSIGVSLGSEGRRWLFYGLVIGAAANAVVATAQVVLSLNSQVAEQSGFGLFQGTQADGMLGNPIHLEAILLGAMALIMRRSCVKPWPWVLLVGLLATGLEFSSERLGIILLVGLVVAAWIAFRFRAAYFTVAAAVGFLAPLIAGSGVALANRVAASTASGTFTLRFTASLLGMKATLLHAPLFGFGPGEARNAVNLYGTKSFATRLTPGKYFFDLHDIFSNVMTMTGIVGFGLFLAFLVLAGRRARGPFLGFALLVLIVELAEPMNVGVTPLAFLCLGAALAETCGPATAWSPRVAPQADDPGHPAETAESAESADRVDPADRADSVDHCQVPGGGTRRTGRTRARIPALLVAEIAAALLALVPAALLLVGDAYAKRADQQFSLSEAKIAAALVPVWPQNDDIVGLVYAYHFATSGNHSDLVAARQWLAREISVDPSDNTLWQRIALGDMQLGNYPLAAAELDKSLALDPLAVPTLDSEAQLLALEGKWSQSIAELRFAEQLAPHNSVLERAMQAAEHHQVTYFTFGTS